MLLDTYFLSIVGEHSELDVSVVDLTDLGALMDLGRRMVEFPLDPVPSKMLLASVEMECSTEVLVS